MNDAEGTPQVRIVYYSFEILLRQVVANHDCSVLFQIKVAMFSAAICVFSSVVNAWVDQGPASFTKFRKPISSRFFFGKPSVCNLSANDMVS